MAEQSARGPSYRCVRTPRLGCSAPSARPPPCCCRAPSAQILLCCPDLVTGSTSSTLQVIWRSTSNSTRRRIRRGCAVLGSSAQPANSLTGPCSPVDRTPAMPLLHDVAHLAHVELLTPDPERSLWFCTEVLGLTENGSAGNSVYLRTWDDSLHHSIKLTASATSGIRRTGLRAASEDSLQRRGAATGAPGPGGRRRAGGAPLRPPQLLPR